MKKVKIMFNTYASKLEEDINDFIEEKNIIDIKYTSIVVNGIASPLVSDRVLIIYEE